MLRKWLRRAGLALAGLLALLVLAAGAGYAASARRLNRTHRAPDESLSIPTDSASLARGRHLATAIGKCVECHGENLGGKVFLDHPTLGRVVAANLTRGAGGIGASASALDLERAIRHGIRRDGRSVVIMPAEDWQGMSDADVGALIAYIRQLVPVDNVLPPTAIGPLARALLVGNVMPMLQAEKVAQSRHPVRTPPGPTAEYGRYLASVGGCTGCHGAGLSGGPIPGAPPEFKVPSNITPGGIGAWTEADFMRALRTGRRPDGTAIDTAMPWRLAGQMSDEEIRAVYAYLRTLPRTPFGNR